MTRFLFMAAFAMISYLANAQTTFATDSLIADFRHFVHLLEETHPDPYTNYGGRAFFHEMASETRWAMSDDSISTVEELARRINSFIAPLQDGHTSITIPGNNAENDRFAPILFRVINDGITVRELPSTLSHLIGSRLMGIGTMPIDSVYTAAAQLYAAENIIGKYAKVAYRGHQESMIRSILPDNESDTVAYRLLSPEGKDTVIRLPLVTWEERQGMEKTRQPSTDVSPTENLSYGFMDKACQTMYFRSTSIMARDNIEAMRMWGMDFYDDLKYIYKSAGKTMPADTTEAIAALPSFSDTFGDMLLTMRKHKSKNLIIDLRSNSGGWTPIVLPTLYQLWGDEYLKKNMSTAFYRIISPLYMKKMNTTLDKFNKRWNADYEFGDYTYSGTEDKPQTISPEYRANFVDGCMSCVKDRLREQQGQAVYTPENIYVITDAGTFSAAFHYAFYLWKMGAKVVGVASSQAPNTYMEQTPFELPRTGLKGSISNSQQLFLPTDDSRAKVLWPDIPLTYDDLKNYGFDGNAPVLFLLDRLRF